MSTLVVHAPHEAKLPLRIFARVGAALLTVLDVFTEAQRLASEAKQRYPFIDA